LLVVVLAQPPQGGGYAGGQQLRFDGLCDVVVCAGFQAFYLILLIAERGQENNGGLSEIRHLP
jgi:hypothetical protein